MVKDPELKLFGRKIFLPENHVAFAGGECCGDCSNESSNGSRDCDRCFEESRGEGEILVQRDEEQVEGEVCETSAENEDEDAEESTYTNTASMSNDSQKTPPNSEQKALKKPDKILPCPRCKSMDTKFCYYNNYNVNQPRHFCKSCQRYWTAGGSMRNVPVGAGRRKNKNSVSHCRHITITEALDSPNGGFHSPTVLSFGKNTALNENDSSYGGRNMPMSMPWPFPVPLPAIFPPAYPLPLPYYPAPFWSLPWLSVPSSPLGKHSRNGELLNPNTPKSSESSIVVPKTLRIDDPEEAAKSSIWSTLGIKYNSISREGLFKALQPKIDDKKPVATTSPLLQANPAALSRSITFHETA